MFRNPIDIVEVKNGHKMIECKRRGTFKEIETEKQIFEAHVEFYSSHYIKYLDRQQKWPIVKLEDLNRFLRTDIPAFRKFFETYFKVELSDNHIKSIKELSGITGDLSRAYTPNEKDVLIFKSWDTWKQEIFLKYFKSIMLICNYKWE